MTQWNLGGGRKERRATPKRITRRSEGLGWRIVGSLWITTGRSFFAERQRRCCARAVFRKILFENSLRLHMLPKGLRFGSVGKLDDALAKCRAHANRLRRQVPDPFDLASEARISASLQHGILFHRGTPRGSSQEMVLGCGASGGGAGFCARGLLWSGVFQVAVQAGTANPQNLCRAQAVALAHVQHAVDMRLRSEEHTSE